MVAGDPTRAAPPGPCSSTCSACGSSGTRSDSSTRREPSPSDSDARTSAPSSRLGSRASARAVPRWARRRTSCCNISGMLRDERVLSDTPIRVYLDLDPVFNQLWHAQGVDMGSTATRTTSTVGPARALPTGRRLDPHPAAGRARALAGRRPDRRRDAFTTVANWRGYGSIEHDGVRYGQKAHSLRSCSTCRAAPTSGSRSRSRSTPTSTRPRGAPDARLAAARPAARRAGTPDDYARFVRGSKAELGIAKEGYVVSRCGWFSDRSAALPRLRPAGGRAGHRLRRAAADRSRAARLRRRRRRARRDRRASLRLRPPCQGRARDRRRAPRLAAGADPAPACGRARYRLPGTGDPRDDRR